MIAIPAGILVIVVHEPVSFSCGIDGMRGHCVSITQKDPIESGYFLFVNKRKNQARVIWYDGQGFSLCSKGLSSGKFTNWPRKQDDIYSTVEYFQAQGILSNSKSNLENYHPVWKKT